ncbi:M64 family metallopeptidase [Williamwhitmania taraxaci]|uniref:IgA peptidase. Metallo peptidase. MEROPS family M64 n=1 Tax=Williamwhitmania taraxaci TaxID=1640674 RepID=A0A1G6GMA3_9BACT|nr:M64 family metallopeptidase [Williamwhitmania taraxaci]SDB83140.1 IgA peptidase. Metallo peptidase. MEROPS family M64 [Williamwhitmania taraxaci]
MYKILIIAASTLLFSCNSKPKTVTESAQFVDSITVVNQGDVSFETFFTPKTMRLDYFHTGNAKTESFAIDQALSDGPWAGSSKILIDKLELGPYLFEVIDAASKALLYSRGYASIFGEWQTTPEAESQYGTFHESLRFPWPLNPIIVKIKKRNTLNKFETIFTTTVDPSSRLVNPADRKATEVVDAIQVNGPAADKLDIVILGDGYSKAEMAKFRADAKRLSASLMNAEPFRTRVQDINIRAVETPADESGVSRPHFGINKRSPLSVRYSTFDSERYALSYDNKTIRDVASAVPYEFMVILINEKNYGGGGIYNLYTTVAADNKFSEYIMIHEMGHHMAALADEYYTSSVSYEAPNISVEPWEPNITALLDKPNLKWKELVSATTPIPTPWNKEEFDKFGYGIQKVRDSLRNAKVPENIMENLFIRQMNQEDELFSKEKYRDVVGAFEGAGYTPKGLYRSQIDCIMYTRHQVFCKVCQRSIQQVIDQYSK